MISKFRNTIENFSFLLCGIYQEPIIFAQKEFDKLFETYHITFVGKPLMDTTTTVLPHTYAKHHDLHFNCSACCITLTI